MRLLKWVIEQLLALDAILDRNFSFTKKQAVGLSSAGPIVQGATGFIETVILRDISLEVFRVHPSTAHAFSITSIKLAGEEQLQEPTPAYEFSEYSGGMRVRGKLKGKGITDGTQGKNKDVLSKRCRFSWSTSRRSRTRPTSQT